MNGELQDALDGIERIYKESIVPFEEADDFYHDKMGFYYDMWSTTKDGVVDLWRDAKNVGRGIFDAIADFLVGAYTLASYLTPETQIQYRLGMLSGSNLEQKMMGMDSGMQVYSQTQSIH